MSTHIVNAKKHPSQTGKHPNVMSSPDTRSIVCHTELLQGLSPKTCEMILATGHIQHVSAGAYLFNQGDQADVCYVVLSGETRLVQLTPGGKRVIIDIIGPGAYLGFFVAFSNKQYPVSAEIIENSDLYAWDAAVMRDLALRTPQLIINTISTLTNRVICLQTKVQQLATERVEQRIAHSLLSLARNMGREQDGGILINMPLRHQDLAEMSGTNIYSVSRALKKWKEEGIIAIDRMYVFVSEPNRLYQLADDES